MTSGSYIPGTKRFVKHNMNDRQKKSFIMMYNDSSYSISSISERFGIAQYTVTELAKQFNLPMRKGRS